MSSGVSRCGFPRGQITVVLGGSGAGKSTLLRLIGGLTRPDAGSVRVAGQDVTRLSERQLFEMRERIGMLFQGGALLDSMTVFDNVALPLREHTELSEADIAAEVSRRLEAVGLRDTEDLYPRQLSGGMNRRAALARAIVTDPEIVLCDEPFSGLDPINVRRIENAAGRAQPAPRPHDDRHLAPPGLVAAHGGPHRLPRGRPGRLGAVGGSAAERRPADRRVPGGREPGPRGASGGQRRGCARIDAGGWLVRTASIEALGLRSLGFAVELGRIAVFVGRVVRALLLPRYRVRRIVNEVFDVGVLSLAIICLSGLTVGAVLGLQGYDNLARFGAEGSLGAVVGLSLVRELGPVLTALLVTGRAGSAMAAEIASMVTTEQLDGLRMMSIDPIDFVVSPKALAMLLVMPLLNGLFIVFALFGGYLIGVSYLGLDGGQYLTSLEDAVDFESDIAVSLLKSVVFGGLVAIIATYRGYTSEPTAAGVSAATTGTVVVASVCVLLFDYVITALWGV